MQKLTRTDVIVFSLTDDIVGRRLPPGETLDEALLGQRFGVSRTPIREALRQLAASGLVQLRPHRAPIVVPIDEQRLADMFEVMAELEALCAARAAIAIRSDQRAALVRHHRAMGDAMRSGDIKSYRAGNVEFHAMIYEGAGNAYLRELAQSTRIRLAPYRSTQLEAPARLAKSYAEHDGIVTALLRGDSELSARLTRHHLILTRDALRGVMHGKIG